ncbi:hypothetical protein Q5P01_000768 [Channa striata]|uniref:Uncharacterized protein n=1 Tax=Channa striata TaxID=64152 RepID=A0AA88ID41_CHASR|nr:hypothetical protein Q5P01_000768 [Channa striata]
MYVIGRCHVPSCLCMPLSLPTFFFFFEIVPAYVNEVGGKGRGVKKKAKRQPWPASVIVTPRVYPRFIEFLHFDIQSTGQKSHRSAAGASRRPAGGPRERVPAGAVAGEIREKGPARVQSRRRRPPYPIPPTGPPSTRRGPRAGLPAEREGRRATAPQRASPAPPHPSPTDPALRANPYPEVTDLICRLPLTTLPAADMGTAWREIYTFSPGFSRASESSPDAAGTATLSRARAPLSGRTHSRAPCPSQRKENSPRGSRQLLRDRLRYRTGRLAAPISATPDSGI